MHPNLLIVLALCALVIILAGNSLRLRKGSQGSMPKRQQGMLLGLIITVGAILALFVFNKQ